MVRPPKGPRRPLGLGKGKKAERGENLAKGLKFQMVFRDFNQKNQILKDIFKAKNWFKIPIPPIQFHLLPKKKGVF